MKIVSLLENTAANANVQPEHGLCLYIETGEHRILFDMGQTALFAENAKALGVDLAAVDLAVLSHGHYDHGGGLATFLEINQTAPVYVSEHAFLPHYNGTQKYIGLDTALMGHPRLVTVKDVCEIAEGLTLYSCNDRAREHDLGSFGLTERVGDAFVPDDFRHEQYLLIREGTRRVLISGCSHKGILDITEWFLPDVLIGGFHFSKMPLDHTLAEAARALDAHATVYYTCHCTGAEQYAFMKKEMKNLHYLACGETVEV